MAVVVRGPSARWHGLNHYLSNKTAVMTAMKNRVKVIVFAGWRHAPYPARRYAP